MLGVGWFDTAGVTVSIRPGGPADADAAVAVWHLANTARRGGVAVAKEQEQRVRGYLGKRDSFVAVADESGALVGMALGMQGLEDDGAGAPIPGLCHISMVFVDPVCWGRGIGKLLMQHLLELGRGRGYTRFQLWTQADNQRAQHLYERLGFRLSGRKKHDDMNERVVHYELSERRRPAGSGRRNTSFNEAASGRSE